MTEKEVLEFNIPTAVPLVYELDKDLKYVKDYYSRCHNKESMRQNALQRICFWFSCCDIWSASWMRLRWQQRLQQLPTRAKRSESSSISLVMFGCTTVCVCVQKFSVK